MSPLAREILLVLFFTICGGFFAAAEMALISLRDSQIKRLRTRGRRGQRVGQLAADPQRFLSAVQIGVTLFGFLSSAFGGATIAGRLSPLLMRLGLPDGMADTAALVVITILISYLSIVLGELTAKRLAMQRAETFAMALGPTVDGIARALTPVIWLLEVSTNAVMRLLGGRPDASREEVTDEEIRSMVSDSSTLGAEERRILDDVFDAGDRSLREVMVPRTEVDFLPGDTPTYKAVRELSGAPHSRYPVTGASADDVLGFVHVRDLFDPGWSQRATPVEELVRPIANFPQTVNVLYALAEMRRVSSHMAIVRDEYGGTAGIVTMEDLVEELIGDITDEYDIVEKEGPISPDTREIDGLTSLEDFEDETGLSLPEGPYDTLAGWFMSCIGAIPEVGDSYDAVLHPVEDPSQTRPVTLSVLEMDGRRAARFLLAPTKPKGAGAARVAAGDEPVATQPTQGPAQPDGEGSTP
ncbi:putative hemolysin [Raineyella antarctica]|uniref:Putative hemolysin n=1 Tax=Raineyella antarctica TaxID=1577474 RepID=A0A1G6H5M3_9ACTN|nr:hemolysin family protein [Raineyella antarctica]SDB89245.1 putative hemolysin [Raineyella antarctica]